MGMLARLAIGGIHLPCGRVATSLLNSTGALLTEDDTAGDVCAAMCLSTASSSSWLVHDMAVLMD